MTVERGWRFVTKYNSDLEEDNWDPIKNYKNRALKSIEDAVKSLVPLIQDIETFAKDAKDRCKKDTILTPNESAAIYLYTKQKVVFERFNADLRLEDPSSSEPWLDFTKLFITALKKLQPHKGHLWRGVTGIEGSNYYENRQFIWWSATSCSPSSAIADIFSGEKGVLFSITAINGRDISKYSAHQDEKEVILMPGTRLRVVNPHVVKTGFSIVDLEEW